MNMNDRRSIATACPGQLVGSTAHGAAKEAWVKDARPFALAVRDNWVYHGVVNSARESQRRADLAAYVFAARPDGSDMHQVARVELEYDRGKQQRWVAPARRCQLRTQQYPQPMLTDIEFTAAAIVLGRTVTDTGPSLVGTIASTPATCCGCQRRGRHVALDPAAPGSTATTTCSVGEIGMGVSRGCSTAMVISRSSTPSGRIARHQHRRRIGRCGMVLQCGWRRPGSRGWCTT
jgi:hypothetical protein